MRKYKRRLKLPPKKTWEPFRQYLRYEFRFRCCYCGTHEYALPDRDSWQIDHFEPRNRIPKSRWGNYQNLYYACKTCNSFKSGYWPDQEDEDAGRSYVDPCRDRIIGDEADLRPDGLLVGRSPAGAFTIERINLNRWALVQRRRDTQWSHKLMVSNVMRATALLSRLREANRNHLNKIVAEMESLIHEMIGDMRPVKYPYDQHEP